MPRRYGTGTRWADMVVHRGVAYWVEVADDRTCDARGQIAQVLAQIIEERRREFFLEGHRLGDIRRYGIELNPASGTLFPNGGTYGSQSCFPLPDVERANNPNFVKP